MLLFVWRGAQLPRAACVLPHNDNARAPKLCGGDARVNNGGDNAVFVLHASATLDSDFSLMGADRYGVGGVAWVVDLLVFTVNIPGGDLRRTEPTLFLFLLLLRCCS